MKSVLEEANPVELTVVMMPGKAPISVADSPRSTSIQPRFFCVRSLILRFSGSVEHQPFKSKITASMGTGEVIIKSAE